MKRKITTLFIMIVAMLGLAEVASAEQNFNTSFVEYVKAVAFSNVATLEPICECESVEINK